MISVFSKDLDALKRERLAKKIKKVKIAEKRQNAHEDN